MAVAPTLGVRVIIRARHWRSGLIRSVPGYLEMKRPEI